LQAEHALIATRARLLSDSSVDSLRSELTQAAAALRNPPNINATPALKIRQLAKLYGGAVASSMQRDAASALRYADAAKEYLFSNKIEALPHGQYAFLAIELIAIEAHLMASSISENGAASAMLTRLLAHPSLKNERPALLIGAHLARNDSAANRSAVIDALQTWVSERPSDAPAWEALAKLFDAQGQALRSLRAQAEARVALLDYGAALDRLKAAQEWAQANGANHIESSILDTRTRAVQTLVRELQNERDKP
jgi:predicted Zn-dependent protease